MRLKDRIRVRGVVHICMRDRGGNVVETRRIENLLTLLGADMLAARVYGTSIAPVSHIALGSGTTPAADGNTALENELGRAALFASSYLNGVSKLQAYFGPNEATGLLGEVGLLNAGVDGILTNRATFLPFEKGATNIVTVTWNVQFSGV